MAVTNIPNVQNWTVTPQNGQSGYFDLMNTWLGQSTLVIASLQSAITSQNLANSEINTLATDTNTARDEAVDARDEAVTSLAILSAGSINDTSIATNKAYSNSKSNTLLALKMDKDVNSLAAKATPVDADEFVLADSASTFSLKKLTWSNLKANLLTYVFGVGQTMQSAELTNTGALFTDGTSKYRTAGVTYTNSKNKAIQVEIVLIGTNVTGTRNIGGNVATVANSNTGSWVIFIMTIPPLTTYSLTLTTGSVTSWNELR